MTFVQFIYFFSEKSASSQFELLGNIAKEIKGKGTVAFVNCG